MDEKKIRSQVAVRLTVYFEEPFWIGVLERMEGEYLSACKITFGAEPRDYEVEEWLLQNYYKLRFSPGISLDSKKQRQHTNPKRLQRMARKETEQAGIGTKSQQALKLLQEENKMVRKQVSRERKLEEKERMYELKVRKKKEKKRGR